MFHRGSQSRTFRALRHYVADLGLTSTRFAEDAIRTRSGGQGWRTMLVEWREELFLDFRLSHHKGAATAKGAVPTMVVVEETFPEPLYHSGAYRLTNIMNLALQLGLRVVVISLRDRNRAVLEGPLQKVTDLVPSDEWSVAELVADLRSASVLWVCRPYAASRMMSVLRASPPMTRPATVVFYPVDMHHVRVRRWGQQDRD